MPENPGAPKAKTWAEVVKPHVERWRLAAMLGQSVTHNSVGCAAMATLLEGMADKLDIAVDLLRVKHELGELSDDDQQ